MIRTVTRTVSRRAGAVPPVYRTAALAIALLAALPGCIQHHDKVEIGLKRVSLDLAFKDLSKAKPPTVQQVLVSAPEPATASLFNQLPPAQVQQQTPTFNFAPSTAAVCATAPAGATPETPASVFITKTPGVGAYKQHNTGTFDLQGVLKLSGPYPPKSVEEIANVQTTPNKDFSGNPDGTNTITYDVVQKGLGNSSTTYSYKNTSKELDLTKFVIKTDQTSFTFSPIPAVKIMDYKGEGATWTSGGIDPNTGTAMIVSGAITKRENVDVCGTVYETYRVESKEQITNISGSGGFNSKTDDNDPNVYDVATQMGGLFIRQHIHTTTTFSVNGAPFILNLNYTSVFDRATPFPAGTQAY